MGNFGSGEFETDQRQTSLKSEIGSRDIFYVDRSIILRVNGVWAKRWNHKTTDD
ncbi:hypothetical protein LEP1GSC195_3368 [Leptospira wolbachii serovar Codice str. CDC]|uniref:Uncharacterized protein n=1 Tax=Leptospira wolbachii serovar Codice str. CDC TaxID=1218599 RepID=R8ZZ31_9LEPT|nr:hypothetical protein LEP1GSC195_3368 [Leptospira wolbachii serovar Codice str. CDC]